MINQNIIDTRATQALTNQKAATVVMRVQRARYRDSSAYTQQRYSS